MWKWIKIILTGVIVSLFFFPFEFSFLRGVNTKMAMAAVGILISAYYLLHQRSCDIPRNVLLLFLYSGIVSMVGVFSVTYNNTTDNAYATYITSMAVWLSAALVVCCWIRMIHGKISVPIVVNYLGAVCVAQCALAIIIDNVPSFKMLVDTYIQQDQDFLNEIDRLYGIGAWLDVAGARFSAVLVMLFYVLYMDRQSLEKYQIYLYVLAIVVIVIIGCMISRTTTVGLLIGLVGYVSASGFWRGLVSKSGRRVMRALIIVIVAGSSLMVYLYNTNPEMRHLIRFAFEGFFNYVENGSWETSSTDKLQTMYVFPDNGKTWIIGDGYFINPNNDINYVGDSPKLGYYKGTDVGYLRFIFYFGLIGLFSFTWFLWYAAQACAELNCEYRWMFFAVFTVGMVIWLKVATDLFCVFSLFICIGNMFQGEEDPNLIEE